MNIERVENWKHKLGQLIQKDRNRLFEWGVHDCCMFAASAIEAQTGHDPAAKYRETYRCERSALEVMKKEGCEGLRDFVELFLGAHDGLLNVRRGDIALINFEGRDTLGVVYGGVIVPGEKGLVSVPLQSCIMNWRVG